MRWISLGVIAAVVLFGARPAHAQTTAHLSEAPKAVTVTEQEILERWLKRSPEVASWRSQIGAARFDIVTARVWPNFETTFLFNVNVDGTPPDSGHGYQVELRAPLPIFGQRGARVRAAESHVSVAEMTVVASLWDRAAEIQRSMVERAYAAARVQMLERNLDELARIRRIVLLRTVAGANSQYDVLRVDTGAGTIRAALQNASVERTRAEAKLLALIADPTLPSAPIETAGLTAFRGPESEAALLENALRARPDLELARRGVRAAEAEATRLRREAIPTPSVVGGAYLVERPYGLQVTAGVSLPLPFFDRNQGAIGRALTEAEGAQSLVRAIEPRIRAEVSGAFRARKDARAALDEFRAGGFAAATELLRRAEVSYQAGAFSIAELFDAYQTMWSARLQELDLDRQRAEAEVELERAAVLAPLDRR